MRLLLLIAIATVLVPGVLAETSTSGWYYAGDTFEWEDTVYSVEGSDHDNVLLGVGGRLHLIGLYECKEEGLTELCYTDTAYPDDDDHIKYDAGDKYYGYHVAISVQEPSVSVSRSISEEDPALGEDVTVTVTIDNTGDYTVHNLVYEEAIPKGLHIASGPKRGNSIYQEVTTLRFNTHEKIIYRLVPQQFGEYTLSPTTTYTHEGKEYNISVSDEEINVDTPFKVDRLVTSELEIDEVGTYEINVTNLDDEETLHLTLSIVFPDELHMKEAEGFTKEPNGTLTKEFDLAPEQEEPFSFEISSEQGGTYSIILTAQIEATGISVIEEYTDTVTSKEDKLAPTISFSPSRDAYYSDTELTISGVLENMNDNVKFNTVQGKLSSELFKDLTFKHESFPAGKKLTEATLRIDIPSVNESTTYSVDFTGTYNSPTNRIFEFSSSKNIVVIPRTSSVSMTREVNPQPIERGSNITIQVSLKNTYGEYLTLDVHEKYSEGLVKVSGLTFAETSLDKDATENIYLYQLEIPEDYSKDSITLTTVVKVKDQPLSEEYETEIFLNGAATPTEAEETEEVQEAVIDVEEEQEDKEELGFFASIWDFLKGIFS